MRSSLALLRALMASLADCLRGTGAKGLKLVAADRPVESPISKGERLGSPAFSGDMVEISSLGPKSKPKLKLVSKEVLASFGVTAGAGVSSVAKPKSKLVSSARDSGSKDAAAASRSASESSV